MLCGCYGDLLLFQILKVTVELTLLFLEARSARSLVSSANWSESSSYNTAMSGCRIGEGGGRGT